MVKTNMRDEKNVIVQFNIIKNYIDKIKLVFETKEPADGWVLYAYQYTSRSGLHWTKMYDYFQGKREDVYGPVRIRRIIADFGNPFNCELKNAIGLENMPKVQKMAEEYLDLLGISGLIVYHEDGAQVYDYRPYDARALAGAGVSLQANLELHDVEMKPKVVEKIKFEEKKFIELGGTQSGF